MDAIAEIDKAGRFVLPKKMRDALHLVPGTRVSLHLDGDSIVIEPAGKPSGLIMVNGTLTYDAGRLQPLDVVDFINMDRVSRIDSLTLVEIAR